MAKPFSKHVRNVVSTTLAWIAAITLFAMVRLYGASGDGLYLLIPEESGIWVQILSLGFGLGATFGIIFGALDTVKGLLRNQPYWMTIVVRSAVHIVLTLLIILGYLLLFHWIMDDKLAGNIVGMLKDTPFQKISFVLIIYTGFVSIIFNLIRQMNRMYGPGILYKLLIGKYHQPQEEERIFMFLDLKSSTTYAERLGHVLYSELIQDCFQDLTHAIEVHDVEVYQYVGDEAVLTWRMVDGLRNANCIKTFFTFDETIQKRANYYFNKYDLVPAFKAGVNLGLVMVAEVGVVKKEIAYHSDVLNTAARIQGRCNEFKKQILITESLKERLENEKDLLTEYVGNVALKGKENRISIYSVSKKEQVEHSYEFAE
ncbi:MAG: adenylate/guanylate cyclase domain-containing protein [Bacteroidia bacterium]|nr:adenylate/guanylate cyclase domain-containing protein [Bacteroidia bacterium]